MPRKQLWILLEGNDDERFFERIIKPPLEKKGRKVKLWKYCPKTKKKINRILRFIKTMNYDYIFTGDIDDCPCISKKKQVEKNKYRELEIEKIDVVIKEIESWYLAGLDADTSRNLGISYLRNTDDLRKERFNNLLPKRFDNSLIDFKQELLNYYKITSAKRRNKSFKHFCSKHL